MQTRLLKIIAACLGAIAFFAHHAAATSNYAYKPGEYVTIVNGKSPDGRYSIAAHGEGDLGYDHFHIYLVNSKTGKKIGPLEEIKNTLDTGADAFYAKWSDDSEEVAITYRIERHTAVKVVYIIGHGKAVKTSGPEQVEGLPRVETPNAGTGQTDIAKEAPPAVAPAAQPDQPAKEQQTSNQGAGALKVGEIQAMSAAGIKSSAIIDAIKESNSVYSSDDIAALQQSDKHVPPEVIDYIKNPAKPADNASGKGSSNSETKESKPKKKSGSGGSSIRERTKHLDNI